MRRQHLENLGIKEVRTNNGGVITLDNAMTKESRKAQSALTGSKCTVVYNNGYTTTMTKAEIARKGNKSAWERNKQSAKRTLCNFINSL